MHMPFRLFHIVLLLIALQSTGGVWGQEEGLASYYHERFHGRKSSSGRIHDKDEMVAAHRTHPFGTYLRWLELIYPKFPPTLTTEDMMPKPPYRMIIND